MKSTFLLPLTALLLLTGCIGDQKHQDKQDNTVIQAPPVVNVTVPKAETVDLEPLKKELKTEIQTSSNNTQNQLSGLVNTSISKIAEKVVGLEASISANMTNTAVATLSAEVKAQAELNVKMQADIRNSLSVKTELQNTMNAVAELKVQLGEISASLKGVVAGQAGVGNKMETLQQDIKNTAGRDVNTDNFPKEAVTILVSNNEMWMYIMGGVFSLITTVAGFAYRNARLREQATAKLLMQALAQIPPEHAAKLNL